MKLARDADALSALARSLPGVSVAHCGRVGAIAVDGAEVALLLRDGRALVGKVVAADEASVRVAPWGCSRVVELAASDIVLAATAAAKWEAAARLGVRMRREWR